MGVPPVRPAGVSPASGGTGGRDARKTQGRDALATVVSPKRCFIRRPPVLTSGCHPSYGVMYENDADTR